MKSNLYKNSIIIALFSISYLMAGCNDSCTLYGHGYDACVVASGYLCTWSEIECSGGAEDGNPVGACHLSDGSDGCNPSDLCNDGIGGPYECEENGLISCCNGTCAGVDDYMNTGNEYLYLFLVK